MTSIFDDYMKTELEFDDEDIIKRIPLIDFITIKEIFRYTLKWKNPQIQKLILEKVDDEDHVELLSTADLDLSHSLLIDLVDVDDVEITQTVLSAIQNEKMLIVFENPMNYTALSIHFG